MAARYEATSTREREVASAGASAHTLAAMGMDAYDYALPEAAIAQVPVEPRDSARLLVATHPSGTVVHRRVRDLPSLLARADVLVVNDSRVVPARLRLRKPTGGRAEVLLVERRGPSTWEALVRPGRRLAPGARLLAGDRELVEVGERLAHGLRHVRLLDHPGGSGVEAWAALALPPYVRRPLEDPERYQTVYAAQPGSVAAPTAGLHLTHEVLDGCRQRGVEVHTVDLAVGLDTFSPVTAQHVEDHVMHSER